MRPDPRSFRLSMCPCIQTEMGLMGRLCLLLFWILNLQISTQCLLAQAPLDPVSRQAISNPFQAAKPTLPATTQKSPESPESAGQVASVFESEPEWLEWIASKNSKSKSKSAWSSWWPSGSKTKTARPVRSYETNNKTLSQRLSMSSKRMWNKTTEWLDPYPDPKPPSEANSKKSSWFSSWGNAWGAEPKKQSQSVSDFIGQEHPR